MRRIFQLSSYRGLAGRSDAGQPRLRHLLCLSAVAIGLFGGHGVLTAQVAEPEVAEEVGPVGDELIRLNFSENVPLTTLIVLVTERLNLNIMYDQTQVAREITLRTPSLIPKGALLDLLRAVLAAHDLILEETAVPGLLRIVSAQEMANMARFEGDPALTVVPGVVTRVFEIRYIAAERVQTVIQPLLSTGGKVNLLPQANLLVVTDRVGNLERVERMVAIIDASRGDAVTLTYQPEYVPAEQLRGLIEPIRQAMANLGDEQARINAQVMEDPRTNRLVIVGLERDARAVLEVAQTFDVPSALERRVYRPQVISPERLEALIRQVAVPQPTATTFRATTDASQRLLVVAATSALHAEIEDLLEQVDQPPEVDEEPVRFYRLKNTIAADVLATIRALESEGQAGLAGVAVGDDIVDPPGAFTEAPLFGPTPPPPDLVEEAAAAEFETAPAPEGQRIAPAAPGEGASRPRIAVDANTNSIIVIAPPAQQRLYARIIEALDVRRPQVLIETTIVSMDTSDDFSLGVEIGGLSGFDDGELITFSSFGLSEVDPLTGRLTPTVSNGANIALLSPDIADVVIKALSSSSRARLVSMPQILVNDNEEGMLQSVNKEPFQRTVVTESTTIVGEGDTAEAGTTITVTPHISEGDYLQLAYAIELSTFTGQREPNLPPPSQSNNVAARVTIPDGHTIVVGGLSRKDYRETLSEIPLLGQIPLIEHLFQSQTRDEVNTTLFIFIRPTILRDDQFRDLKYISGLYREQAELKDDFPSSKPMLLPPVPPRPPRVGIE